MTLLARLATRARNAAARLKRGLAYRRDLRRGRPAGDAFYSFVDSQPVESWCLELRLTAERFAEGRGWAERQTLESLRVTDGARSWAKGGDSRAEGLFFYAPGSALDEADPAFAESAAMILAAEDIDAIVFSGSRVVDSAPAIDSIDDLARGDVRPFTVFRSDAWSYDAERDEVRPTKSLIRAKILLPRLVEPGAPNAERTALRRGAYLSNHELGPRAELRLFDASLLRRTKTADDGRPRMLVLVPFLARGGAEHTIFETLRALKNRWHMVFVSLAPHRPELDDRRADFQAIWPGVISLGDFVHPAAMPGMLSSLFDAFEPDVLYNANSTTLFFDFLPALRAQRADMRIIDHLYDHRVGYIERYREPKLRSLVDAIVAENRRIRDALAETYDWPAERAPVVWPCGRPPRSFPSDAATSRAEARAELGLAEDDVVVLTAARMHEQKRPLDLVRLAERVVDLPRLCFLVVGGGPLEDEVDRAADEARSRGARLIRQPFRDDIPRLIQACDAGCLVSNYEGLPVFLLECLQAGRPFLGTDVGDLGFVLRGTSAGWVVDEPGDLDALEAAVRRLEMDDERQAKGAAAFAAAPRFSVEACAERYDAVFRGEELGEIELGMLESEDG